MKRMKREENEAWIGNTDFCMKGFVWGKGNRRPRVMLQVWVHWMPCEGKGISCSGPYLDLVALLVVLVGPSSPASEAKEASGAKRQREEDVAGEHGERTRFQLGSNTSPAARRCVGQHAV